MIVSEQEIAQQFSAVWGRLNAISDANGRLLSDGYAVGQESALSTVSTTNNTQTTLATVTIPASTTMLIEARVAARRTGGSSGTAEDGAGYVIYATIKNVAGTATIIGSVSADVTQEDQAGWDATITVTGATALVRVTGAVNNNVDWKCALRTLSVS